VRVAEWLGARGYAILGTANAAEAPDGTIITGPPRMNEIYELARRAAMSSEQTCTER
jgi:hypothetical protein